MPRVIETEMWSKQRELTELVLEKTPRYRRIGTGGSRGGGKSTVTGRSHVLACLKYPRLRTIILRKGTEDVVHNYRDQVQQFLQDHGLNLTFRYLEGKHYFRGINGSSIRLGFIAQEKDYGRYLGHEYGLISLTEAQEHERKRWGDMGGSNRAGGSDYVPRMTADFNPGGIGNDWLNELFVDPKTRPDHYYWIPTWIWDCPSTIIKNPNYIKENLLGLPEWQVKQWLWGRFDALAGQYFVIPPWLIKKAIPKDVVESAEPDVIEIPQWAQWSCGVDYGDEVPFALVYAAKWRDLWTNREHVHFVKEVYEANLDLDQQAIRAMEAEADLRERGLLHGRVVYYGGMDIKKKQPSESDQMSRTIAQVWKKYGFRVKPCRTNNRVYGWKLMKMLYRHEVLTVDESCKAFLNESFNAKANGAPGPPIDEDIQQAANLPDHALEAGRYNLVSIFPHGYKAPKTENLIAFDSNGREIKDLDSLLKVSNA